MLTQMFNDPVSKFINRNIPKIDANLPVSDAAKQMVNAKSDCILVVTNYNMIGIITLKDILIEVVAKGNDPKKTLVNQIAKKPVIKIHESSKVKDAIELMKKHDIRRLIVVNNDIPIGLISQKAVIGNMDEYDVALPELEIPDKVLCPYCPSLFQDKNSLSRHIDNIHIGRGLLEGNLAQMKK